MKRLTEAVAGGMNKLLTQLLKYKDEVEKRRSDALAIAGRLKIQLERMEHEIESVSFVLEMWRDQQLGGNDEPKEKPPVIGEKLTPGVYAHGIPASETTTPQEAEATDPQTQVVATAPQTEQLAKSRKKGK